MDFITRLLKSNGKSAILIIINKLSKYSYFSAPPRQFTTITIAKTFVAIDICKLHGIPKTILLDRDPIFMRKELFKLNGTTLSHCSAYHPQIDNQTEITNKTQEYYLRTFVMEEPTR